MLKNKIEKRRHFLESPPASEQFCTTRWSIVLAAGQRGLPQATEALEQLCRAYWYPLYAHVRRQGNSPEDAQDLTQEFFFRLLQKNSFIRADRERGRFRAFLLGALKNFLVNEWKRSRRLKRGGGQALIPIDADAVEDRYAAEPVDGANPDAAYDQRWGVALIEQVLFTARSEYCANDNAELFEELKGFIWGNQVVGSQAEIARKLNLTEGAVKVAACRLRRRFRELLRAEVAQTVLRPEDVESELRHLISVAV